MSDCSPLRLAENGNSSSPSQSSGGSQAVAPDDKRASGKHGHRPVHHQNRSAEHHIEVSGDAPRRSHHQQGRDYDDHQQHYHGRNDNRPERTRSQSDTSSTKSGQLRYGARNVIELFIPVSLCMMIVVGTMKATESYKYSSQTVIWYAQVMFTDQSVDTGTRVWQSFANALIMLVLIVIMTTVLILLYKFRCYKTIHGWLIMSSLILLFIFAIMYIAEILKVYNVPLDIYTLMISIWNFGVVGMICIHWKGPLLLQQGYLIVISALLALVFIRSLPDWTTWTVLGIVSVWDLVAVLCPRGPLRILVETAQERGEAIFPALIYSSTMMWEVASTVIVTTIPSVTMADANNGRQESSTSRSGQPRASSSSNRRQDRNRRARQQGGSTSSSNRNNRSNAQSSSSKRNQQHPVEIHYEGVAQPPEVDIIQPSLSGTSNDWITPVVRAIDPNHPQEQQSNIGGAQVRNRHQESTRPLESTINFNHTDEQIEHMQIVEEERGVKLGLGDFIFFSLLVGKASSYNDWVITLSCYVAILVGLCLTLSLLAVFRKALPALPISIAFGLCSFFMSYMFAMPFAEKLAINQVFI